MITKDREYRSFEMKAADESEYTVEGYAAVVNTPTVLFTDGDKEYKEQIAPDAFREADMRDVVLNFDHEGKPVARTKNNTLDLAVDERGLKIKAYLGGTEEGRRLFEEVKGGYLDKMSFAFTVSEDTYSDNYTMRTIDKVKRVYDVAIVTFPAYSATEVSARNTFNAEAEKAKIAEARSEQIARIKKLTERE